MIERGTGPKSLMEGLKGGQEVRNNLTVCICVSYCSVSRVRPSDGGSASPFIEEGGGFYKGKGLGCIFYLVLWLTSTQSSSFILVSAKEDRRL